METVLLEKTRIKDETAAYDFAMEGIVKAKEVRNTLRNLMQRRDLAKELGATGQVHLFDREIVRTGRTYRIEHENPYPECTMDEARDAMCEPIKAQTGSDLERAVHSMNARMGKSLREALGPGTLQSLGSSSLFAEFTRLQSGDAIASYNRAVQAMQSGETYMVQKEWSRAYSRQTHKYDLSCENLNLKDLGVEGTSDTGVLLPMSALCRLKEAKDKSLFDHFQVWRPSEWKAPDPWLVGVHFTFSQEPHRYFKVCDWR